MRYKSLIIAVALILMFWGGSQNIRAEWTEDGNQISYNCAIEYDIHTQAQIAYDENGGAVIVWTDFRNGYENADIYAQKIDANGTVQWTFNGIAVCDAPGIQNSPDVVFDGTGGVIITWADDRTGTFDIYGQRLDSSGTPLWPGEDGKLICGAASNQMYPKLSAVSRYGYVIVVAAWLDYREPYYEKLYTQRLRLDSGAGYWTTGGVDVTPNQNGIPYFDVSAACFSSYQFGAILSYTTSRSSTSDPDAVFAQAVGNNGQLLWDEDPEYRGNLIYYDNTLGCKDVRMVIQKDALNYVEKVFIAFGKGVCNNGSCDSFFDYDTRYSCCVCVDPVDGDGVWSAVLEPPYRPGFCKDPGSERTMNDTRIEIDGNDQLIIAWEDGCDGSTDVDLYVQKLNPVNGSRLWGNYGYKVCGETNNQFNPQILRAGFDRVILCWEDNRSGSNSDIYAQVLTTSPAGAPECLLDEGGVVVSDATDDQINPVLSTDGQAGTFIAWWDRRNGMDYQVYASRIFAPERSDVVEILVPNGGEKWARYFTYNIDWNVSDVVYGSKTLDILEQEINVSHDGGETFELVDVIGSSTDYDWFVGCELSDESLIEIITTFEDYTVSKDISDDYFLIYDQKTSWYPPAGKNICSADQNQELPNAVSDGAEGSIITWVDERIGSKDIFAQRINGDGSIHAGWVDQGKAICFASGIQTEPRLVSDGAGGAIIVWRDNRNGNYDIYAQRVNANGAVQWTENGIVICTTTEDQAKHRIISDGSGGAIIVWLDDRVGFQDAYAQRINSIGTTLWTNNGVGVCSNWGPKDDIDIVDDHQGGAILAWEDTRSGGNSIIYAARIDGNGNELWASGGVEVASSCEAPQNNPLIEAINNNEFVVAWYSNQSYFDRHIYCQKINADGIIQWTSSGVTVCSRDNIQNHKTVASDGDGGAIIVWQDDTEFNVYAQKISTAGSAQWQSNGVILSATTPGSSFDPCGITNNDGVLIVTWENNPGAGQGDTDIYAQLVGSDGELHWTDAGYPICLGIGNQKYPSISSDMQGGAIIAWVDYRSDNSDIYAQRIEGYDDIPDCQITWEAVDPITLEPSITPAIVSGCPAGDFYALKVNIKFFNVTQDIPAEMITLDKPCCMSKFYSNETIHAAEPATAANEYETYILHEEIGGCTVCPDPSCSEELDLTVRLNNVVIGQAINVVIKSPDVTGEEGSDGIVNLSDLAVFSSTYNKQLGDPGYNPCMDFTGDDIVNLSDWAFMGEHYLHIANPDYCEFSSGKYVVSNASLNFVIAAEEENNNMLHASVRLNGTDDISAMVIGIDISDESIEHVDWISNPKLKESIFVSPVASHGRKMLFMGLFNMESTTSNATDLGTLVLSVNPEEKKKLVNGGMKVVFGDVLDTNGQIMRLKGVEFVEPEKRILTTYLGNCYPNPFNPSTTIEFALKEKANVSLKIYNVAGQLVKTLVDKEVNPGTYAELWNGRDNRGNEVSSGVYFYRLVTKGFTQTKKMVLLK